MTKTATFEMKGVYKSKTIFVKFVTTFLKTTPILQNMGYNTILLRPGEIFLKGKNRNLFENKLVSNIKKIAFIDQVKKLRGRFIVDYFAEFLREMRKRNFSDQISSYFKLGNNLNQRDVIAVTKTFSGLMKLLYPNQKATKEEIQQVLEYSLEGRRRVKEQLKKIGGMEFYDVNFSYLDNETLTENFVGVPESGGNKLIPSGLLNPGHLYTVGYADGTKIGVYKIELQVVSGSGKYDKSGLNSNSKAKEAANTAVNYFKANAKSISQMISTKEKDYFLGYRWPASSFARRLF